MTLFRIIRRTGAASAVLIALSVALPCRAGDVQVSEDDASFTLANGVVTARVDKASGDLASLKHDGVELLTDKSGHAGGYWSHDVNGAKELIARVTIDPADNGGRRGEVSIKGVSGGALMGHARSR